MLIGRNVSLNVVRILIAYTIYCDELLYYQNEYHWKSGYY